MLKFPSIVFLIFLNKFLGTFLFAENSDLPFPAPFLATPSPLVDGRTDFLAHHPGHDLSVLVTPEGTAFQNEFGGNVFFTYGVKRVGQDQPLLPPGEFLGTDASLNSVTLRRTVLSERVDTLPEGIKQTFLLHERPEGDGPFALVMGVGGSFHKLSLEPDRLHFASDCGHRMVYEDLLVFDANGTVLEASFQEGDGDHTFRIVVNDQDAVYPIEIDPVFRPFRTQNDSFRNFNTRPSDRLTLTEEGTILKMEGDLLAVGVPGFDLFPMRNTDNVRKSVLNVASTAGAGAVEGKRNIKRNQFQQLKLAMQVLGFLGEYRIDDVGAVYVFSLVEGEWQLLDVLNDWAVAVRYDQANFRPTRLDGSRFGETLAIKNRRIMVGAPMIKSETWVNVPFQVRVAGPHVIGGLYFFEQPHTGGPFYRRNWFYGIRSEIGFSDLVTGAGLTDYTEVGRAVALDDSRAVVTSGGGFNPNQIGGQFSGYGPTKFHHFVRDGIHWQKHPDTRTATDLPGRVVHLALINGMVLAVEEYAGATRLWRHDFPETPSALRLIGVRTWPARSGSRFDADEDGFVLSFPDENEVYTGEVTANNVVIEPLTLPPSLSQAGRAVARGNQSLLFTADLGEEERLWLYNRPGDTPIWQKLTSQALPFNGGTRAVGISDAGVAVMGRHADNASHTDLLVYSLNRSISGRVFHPNGQPIHSGFRLGLEPEPTPIPAQAARIFDGANMVPFAGSSWTLNDPRNSALLFSVNDNFPLLDNYLLEITFSEIPPEIRGREAQLSVRLPLQTFTWGGQERLDQPGFGGGRVTLTEGTHLVDLFGWRAGGFQDLLEQVDLQTVGQWEILFGFPGSQRGFPYARVESANLLLVERDAFNRRMVTTDSSGNFRFDNLPPGKYRVVPDPSPFFPQDLKGASDTVDLASNPFASGVQLNLEPALSIFGRALTVGGHPIPDLEFQIVTPSGLPSGRVTTQTQPDGSFRFSNLVSGWHRYETMGVWQAPPPFNIPYSLDAWVSWWQENETDFIIPPMVLSPEVQVRDAAGQPAANTRFRVTGPFGYRHDLISDANGRVRLPGVPNNTQFFTPPKPLVYPGEYVLQGTDSRFDWSGQPARLTLPTGQDESGNPLPLAPLQAVGSEVKVSLNKAGAPFTNQDMLMARVTGETPVLLEHFTAETLQHAVFFRHQQVITLPPIHIAAEPFDRLESIEVLHTGGIQELGEGAELENPVSFRYDLILPDGRALPLSDPVLGLYSIGDWPESKFFSRKMIPEGPLFDREFWPAGEYRLRITYDDNAIFRNVWDHWALRVQVSRRQVDNEFIARTDSDGNAFFPGIPGGQYVVTPAVRDADNIWRNALELEPEGWIYNLDLMEIPSGVTRFDLTKEVQQLHQISGSFFTSTLRPPFVEVRAVHPETGEIFGSSLGDTIGNFTLEGVPSGPISLDFYLEGYAFFSENVTNWDPLTEDISGLQINAFLDTSLTGTLLRPDGEAAADIPLILRAVDRFFPGEPMSFPGLTWRELPLEIDTGVTIDDLSVHYNANYTHETIYLVHPDGTAINLVRPNYFVFGPKVFNDAFEKPRYDGTQFERGREGRVGPSDPLATFRGRPAGGTWRLRIYGATSGQVHVSSWGLSIRPQLPSQNNLDTTFFSDDAGEFLLTDIPPGFFELSSGSDALIIQLDQTEFDFSRQSHDTFSGTVTRPSVRVSLTNESGDPAAGVTVFVNIDGTVYEGDTDANGNAEVFLPDLRPGEIFIAQGEQVYGEPASLPLSFEGSAPEVEFTLLEKASPVVQVDLAHEEPTYPFEVRSESFTFESTVPGTLTFSPEPGTVLDAGAQRVEWTFTPEDNRINRTVSGHLDIEVARADVEILIDSLSAVYTGEPLGISVSSLPEGLPVQILYPAGIPPLAAGLYPVELRVDTDNYFATKSALFEVQRAPASLQIPEAVNGQIVRRIDESGGIPLATTDPSGLDLAFVFRSVESPEIPFDTLPKEIGNYLLTVTHDSDNYFEETTVEFQLLPSLVTVAFKEASDGSIIRTFTGSPQELPSVTTIPAGVRVEYLFSGTQNNGEVYGPTAVPPTRAGLYTVSATIEEEGVTGSASAEFRVERAPLVLEQIQSPGSLSAGVPLDLDTYFQSNAEALDWSLSSESEANGRFIHRVIPWGFSENYPLEVLEMSGGPFGGGGALLANSQARAWTFSNSESFTGSDIESVTTGSATSGVSLIWTIGLNGEVARSGLSFESEAPQVLGVLPLEMRGNIVQFEAGPHHALVLDQSGQAALFTAPAAPSALQTPPEVIHQTNFVSIASGSQHVLLLTDQGDLYAWGENDRNQLVPPELVADQVVKVFAGPVSSHALLSDGRLVSWGTPSFADAQPPEGRHWISVAAGEQYLALLDNKGDVHLKGRISPSLQPLEMSQSPVHDLAPAPLTLYGLRRTSRLEPRTSGELIVEARADNSYDIQPESVVTVSLSVEPRSATVFFDDIEEGMIRRVFSSESATPPVVTTIPGNLPVVVSYSGVSAAGVNYGPSDIPPTDAGNYLIEVIIDAPHYVGGDEIDLVIEPAVKSSPFILSGTSLIYNGENRLPVIQTVPGGLNFEILSPDGSPFSAREPGTYPFRVNLVDSNYLGSLEGELVIQPVPSFIVGISDSTNLTFGAEDQSLPVETTTGLPVVASVLSGPGRIESPNTLVVEGAGIITVQLEAEGSPRFGAVTRTVTFEVSPQSATVQIELPDNPVFTGSPWAVSAITTPADLPVLIEYANGLEPPVQAGSHPVTARIVSPDYTGEANATLTIAKAPVNFLWLDIETVFNGEPQRPRVDTQPTNLDVVLQGPFSESDPVFGGTYTFSATASGPNHFGTSSTEFTIQPRPQVITFAPPLDMTYGDAPQPLSASLDSGRPVRFEVVSGSDIAGVDSDNRLVAFRAGEVVVRAREQNPAERDYAPADPVDYIVQIVRKEVPITLELPSASSIVYDGTPWSAIASADGKIFTRDITLLYNGVEDAPVLPGTYEVEALGENDRYFGQATASFTINKASAAVQVESPLVFTGDAAAPTVTTTPEDLTFFTRWVDRESPPVDVGTYVLEVVVEDPRYEATFLANVMILPRPLTIEVVETELVFTGSPQTLEILTDLPGVAVTQEFFAVDGPQSFGSTITEPGEYTALIEVVDPNYTGITNLPVTILPANVALSVEGPKTFVYNGLDQRPVINSDPAGIDLDWTLLLEGEPVSAAVDAGNYSFTVAPSHPGFSAVLTGEFTVQPAPLTINLSSLTTVYNGSSQTPEVQTLPEEIAVSFAFSKEGAAVSEAVNAGVYTVEVSSSDPNYIGSETETFTIERAPIQISWEAPASAPVNEPITLTALASNGYAVEYALISGEAVLIDGVLTLLGSDPVVLSAHVPGDENYLAAEPVEVTMNPVFTEAQITVSGLSRVYTGGPIEVEVETTPSGLALEILYDGSTTPPVESGSVEVSIRVVEPGYLGNDLKTLVILPAPAVLTLSSGTVTYTGLPLEATILTEPEGLAFQVEYRDEAGNKVFSPVKSGRYTLLASINEDNYAGSMETIWEILPASATLFFDELSDGILRIPFTGHPIDAPAVSTDPEGLTVSFTYEDLRGSDLLVMETSPVERGLYRATATVSDPNYIGSLSAELLLGERPVSFTVPEAVEGQISRIFSGVQVVLPRIVSDPAGIPFQLEFVEQADEAIARNIAPTDVGIYEVRILPTQPYDIGSASYWLNILPQMEDVVFTPPEEVAPGTSLDLAAMLSTLCADFLSVNLISGPLHQTGITVWEQPDTSFLLSNIPDAFSLGVEEMDLNFRNGIALLKTGEAVYWGNLEGSFQPPAGRIFMDVAAGSRSVVVLDNSGFLHFAGSGVEINPPQGVQGNVTAIAAGANSYHAILKNGTVRSWGVNFEGDFPQMPSQSEPVVAVRASGGLAGALDAAGQVHLWGHSFVDTVFLVPNFGGQKVQRLELTSTGALALTKEGELFTWGNPPGNAPLPSNFDYPLVDIALSLSHAHVIDETGALISWGSNPTMTIHPEEITSHGGI